MFGPTTLAQVLIATIPFVAGLPHENVEHLDRRSALPTEWFHRRDHNVHSLFRRQASNVSDLTAVGSPEWTARWPTTDPYKNIPQAWLDALKKAVSSGAIPDIPVAKLTNGTPAYGSQNGSEPAICSATYQCRGQGEIWDAPDGMIGLSVDDGPVSDPQASPKLYDYLKEQKQPITHFMIGANIRDNPKVFLRAFQELGNDIGVHTWSHNYTTTLSNEQVVAELGWTMQIIHDSTGGRVPRYWRPPFGDVDNRVRAIAAEVFGLTSVIWNRDSNDWRISTGGSTLEKVQAEFKEWLAGPRSPGLIILEHEIEPVDVTAFMNALPLIRQHPEWKVVSCAQLFENQPNGTWYLNAQNNTSPVAKMDVGGYNAPVLSSNSSSSVSPSPAYSSAAASGTGKTTEATSNFKPAENSNTKPSAAGTALELPSRLSLSVVAVAILSVLGGPMLL